VNWEFTKCFALTFLLTINTPGFAEMPSTKTTEPNLNITVWVYNYAQIHHDALAQAKQAACRGLPGSTRLVLRIHPRSLTYRANGHSTMFGQAALPDDGGFALQASVYAYGAEELSRGQDSPSAVILGHLMAHELGHLLIGTDTHSRVGVMRPEWTVSDLERARQARLLFSTRNAKRIRAQVRERGRAEEAAGAAGL
jgi:hypothetical protein